MPFKRLLSHLSSSIVPFRLWGAGVGRLLSRHESYHTVLPVGFKTNGYRNTGELPAPGKDTLGRISISVAKASKIFLCTPDS